MVNAWMARNLLGIGLKPLSELPTMTLRLPFKSALLGLSALAAIATVAPAHATSIPAPSDPVIMWNTLMLDAIRQDRTAPPAASRVMAMMNTAVFDAVNSASGQVYTPYALAVPQFGGADTRAAVSQAARNILVAAFPSQAARFDAALATQLAMSPNGAAKNSGISAGAATAQAILALRSTDGANRVVTNPVLPPIPGNYQETGTGGGYGILQQWPTVTPWAMASGDQFRAAPPPSLASAEYAVALNEVKLLGAASSTARTADQTEIAYYWADGAGTWTPPGHWFSIASDAANRQGLSTLESARLFALLGISVADAGIAAWDTKYAFNLWRPVTAIQRGEEDGNPLTIGDASWTPLLGTPPHPSYTSGHSTFSASAAELLALYFGTDSVNFCSASESANAATRCFTSFTEAAMEAGMSRIYGGIHFQFDNQAGLAAGKQIAQLAFGTKLTKVSEPGVLGLFGLGLAGLVALSRRRKA
jgi:hypothetical protein